LACFAFAFAFACACVVLCCVVYVVDRFGILCFILELYLQSRIESESICISCGITPLRVLNALQSCYIVFSFCIYMYVCVCEELFHMVGNHDGRVAS
jgi:hypothetical protein